jgi:hypothetical protein
MKLPIVSRKKYEIARNNLKVESEARNRLRKEFIDFQTKSSIRDMAYQQMEDNCKELCNRLEFMEEKEKDYKREIKALKTLLTKNGIEYKKEEK